MWNLLICEQNLLRTDKKFGIIDSLELAWRKRHSTDKEKILQALIKWIIFCLINGLELQIQALIHDQLNTFLLHVYYVMLNGYMHNIIQWHNFGCIILDSYMWTLPDHPGASRKCGPTPTLPGVRQNLPDMKINFFFSRPSFLCICMVIMAICCWEAINS